MQTDHDAMIITHTINPNGERRIYLGGKSSIECWIAMEKGSKRWTFHVAEAVGGMALGFAERREAAAHMLGRLAETLGVQLSQLQSVAFDQIAALHEEDPSLGRRVAAPKRRVLENGFTASAPNAGPRIDFSSGDLQRGRRRR